jgi:hypothetical protein
MDKRSVENWRRYLKEKEQREKEHEAKMGDIEDLNDQELKEQLRIIKTELENRGIEVEE